MDDAVEVARLLDILGNRNRRRIIELLRQKPCFVTEISDTLVLSPKAVIEHLQMMEREAILSCQMDDRRRKYYYLANDIRVDVSLRSMKSDMMLAAEAEQNAADEQARNAVKILGQMIKAHDQLLTNLEQINHDIEIKINDIARNHKDLFRSEREITVVIALAHDDLTFGQLAEVTQCPDDELRDILRRFGKRNIVTRSKDRFALRGIHA
jgi:ArsR family transcriptional regulator